MVDTFGRSGISCTGIGGAMDLIVMEVVAGVLGTFKKFPPCQKPAKFNVGDVMKTMYKTGAH